MEYDSLIIGAGVGGLSAALKLSSCGKKVLLLEKLPSPGGFATTFTRKGFTFESSLHCVDGLQEGGEIRSFLEECGLGGKIDFIALKDFCRAIYPEHDFVLKFDTQDFRGYLKEKFPQEVSGIDKFFASLDKFYSQFDRFNSPTLPTFLRLILIPFAYPLLLITSMLTADGFISKFIKDRKLKGILAHIWNLMGLPPGRLSALYYLIVFKGYYQMPTSYIKGGSSRLFNAMVDKIKENGSEVRFNTVVTGIAIQSGAVKAVTTDKGEIFKARSVISNANPLDTFGALIDGPVAKKILKKISGFEKSISAFQVYLGLKSPAKELGMDHFMLSLNPDYDHGQDFNAVLSGDYERCSLALVDHAQIEPELVPTGKGSLLIMTLDSYANWKGVSAQDYKAKKEEVARKLIERCEKYLPGLSESIEFMEVATPKTMERYGLSPEGAIYGFAQTPEQSTFSRLAQNTGIKGLFLAGAWTQPGAGVHACFVSGDNAAKLALKFLK